MEKATQDAQFRDSEASLERSGRIEDLIRLYEQRARDIPATREITRLLSRAGELARDRLRNFTRAEDLLRRAHLASPDAKGPLFALKSLYEQKQDAHGLADTLERLASGSHGPQASALYLRAADLHEQKLHRRDRAILCLQLAVREDPQAREAWERITALFMEERKLLSALESLERQRAALGGHSLGGAYAAIAEAAVDEPDAHPVGARAVEVALELDPSSERAQAAKAALEAAPNTWRERVRALRQASLEERDRRKAAVFSLGVARLIAAFEPGAKQKFQDAIDRCFLLWPAMPDAVALFVRVAADRGELAQAEAVLERLAGAYKDRHAQVDLWIQLGMLRLTRKGDAQGALEAFERGVQIDPSRPDAVHLLGELYLEGGRPQDALALYERHLPTLKGRGDEAQQRLRLARLCGGELQDPAAARSQLELALKADPHAVEAAFELCRYLLDAGEVAAVAPHLGLAVCAARPVAERVALCEAVGAAAEAAGNAALSFEALARALALEPGRPGLVESVGEAAAKAEAVPRFAQALRYAAETVENGAAAHLWKNLAATLQTPLSNPAEAMVAWQEVLKRDPADEEAQRALKALQAPKNGANGKADLEAKARKLEAQGADPKAAAELYRQILELAPDDVGALRRLGAASAAMGQWDDVAFVARRLGELAEGNDERNEWRARLAQVYAERLGRRQEAADVYLALLAEGVRTPLVVKGLEKLARGRIREAEIARALAPIYGQSGDHGRQVASLQVQLSSAVDPAEQKRLLVLLAQMHEKQLADSRSALSFQLRALHIDPADAKVREDASRLARELSAELELSRALTEAASRVGDAELAGRLFVDAAELAQNAQNLDEAIRALQSASMSLPSEPRIQDRLFQLLREAGRLSECEQLLARRVAEAQNGERVPLLMELSRIRGEQGRSKDAAETLEQALAMGADESRILPLLARNYEEAGRMDDLSRVLARQIELCQAQGDEAGAARLSLRRARVVDQGIGDHAGAVRNYSEILARRPSDPDALAALEALLDDPACAEQAAKALAPAYEAAKDHRKLVLALEKIATAAAAVEEKVEALRKAAEIHQRHLRQPEMAFAALVRAVAVAPLDTQLRMAARMAAEDAEMIEEFAEQIEDQIEETTEASVRATLHRELAELYEKKLQDRARAVTHHRALLEAEPGNVDGLKALVRLHRAASEWAALVDALEALGGAAASDEEKLAAWRESAQLHEQRLGDAESAAAAWRRIAASNPEDREAALALERLYAAQGNAPDLAFALELRRAQEGQSPQGREVAFRLAQLRRTQLGDPDGALSLYAQILEEDPGHAGARDALDEWARSDAAQGAAAVEVLDPFLARAGDHSRRVSLREARLEFALTDERAKLYTEIRKIAEHELRRPELAFAAASRAFSERLDREALIPELERLAEATVAYGELAELYEQAASGLEKGDAQIPGLLRRAAELREKMGDGDDAARLWRLLLEAAPEDQGALAALSRLYEKAKNARSLSGVYERQAELAKDPAARRALLEKAGAAHEAAGDEDRAVEAFKASLAIEETVGALEALDRLYGRQKRSADQAEVLRQLALLAKASDAQRGYLNRRAAILEKESAYPLAVDVYAEVLALDPQDEDAVAGLERLVSAEAVRARVATLLEPVYRSAKDARKLADALEVRLAHEGPASELDLLREIASLRESLGEKSLAFAAWNHAFGVSPEDAAIRAELERLAVATGAFEELAAAYEDRLERGAQEALSLELWRKLAALYTDQLGRPELAAKALEEVSRREPKDLDVLAALAQLYRKTNAHRELAEVMRRQVNAQPSIEEQVGLLYELGNLAEEHLQDTGIAGKCYRAILERRPGEGNALELLSRILQSTERWDELAEVTQRQIALATDRGAEDEALDLTVKLGKLRAYRLDSAQAGLETFRSVLARAPQHPGAVAALEEMARSEGPLRGEAALALEPVFTHTGDHLRLVQMLESRVSAEAFAEERLKLLRRMSEIYAEHLGAPEQAFITAARALREVPDDEASLALCLKFAGPADADDALIELLDDAAERATTSPARAGIHRALAEAREREGDLAGAVNAYKLVLEASPHDQRSLEALGRLLSAQKRTPELLEVLRRQLALAEEPENRVELMSRIATLQSDAMDDPEGALATFRKLLELSPDHPAALTRVSTLCEQLEKWPELADALERRMAQVGPQGDGRTELELQLARVREDRLSDRAGALELYAAILERDPSHPDALERAEAMSGGAATEVLLSAYRRSKDARKLAGLLQALASADAEPSERKAYLLELAEVQLAERHADQAFMALVRAYRDDPNDAALRKKMASAARAAEAWDELAAVYEEDLPRISDPKDAAEVCVAIAELCDVRLDDAERAVSFFERAKGLDEVRWRAALPTLDRLYTQLSRPEKLAEVLELRATLAGDAAEKTTLLFRLGQLLADTLSDKERAAKAYQTILDVDPEYLPAARLLEEVYEAQGKAELLYKVLEHQRDRVTGPDKERVLGKMAKLSSESLADVDRSIAIWRDVLAKNPRNESAFVALDMLLEDCGKGEELKELLGQRLKTTSEAREVVRLNDRLGRVVWRLLERRDDAVPYFRSALERDPRHKPSLEALREIHEDAGRLDELVAVLRRLVSLQEDPQGVKRVRIRLAEVLTQLSRREEALDAARRALEVEPHEAEDLARVAKVFLALRAWGDAVKTLEQRAEAEVAAGQHEQAVDTLFEVVELWKGKVARPEGAAAPLEKILELDPANRRAYEAARELYRQHNDWRGYAQVTDRFLPQIVTQEEKIASLRELAQLQEQKLGQQDTAFLTVCRALQLDASDDSARAEVERLADATGSHDALAAVYEEIADGLPRGPLAEKLYLTLARIHDEKLDDGDAAEEALRKILEFDPTNARALEALSGAFARRDQHKELVTALEQRVEICGSPSERKALLREIARIHDEKLEEPAEAAGALRRALEVEPDADTFGALVTLYRREKSWPDVAQALARWRDWSPTPEEQARLQNEIAQVYERELGDDEAAIDAYRRALEIHPRSKDARAALEALYGRLGRPEDLLALYRRLLEVTEDFRERTQMLFKSAAIHEDARRDLAGAAECMEGVLALDARNLQAIQALERLHREAQNWESLVQALERHVQVAATPAEQAELCVQMAEVLHQELRQPDRAVETYHRALELDASSQKSLHALGTLYERSGNWTFALEMMGREAQLLGRAPEAVDLHHRVGKIHEEMLMNAASAQAAYEAALVIDPGYLPSIRALKGLHKASENWAGYEQALAQEAHETQDAEAKARAYLELAQHRMERMQDADGATSAFEDALRHAPELLEAARPLADIYVGREDWASAERMLDIVVARMAAPEGQAQDESAAGDLCRQLYRLGYIAEKLDKKDKALASYEKAYALDSTYLPALEGLGNLLVQQKRHEEALGVYQTILLHHRDELTDLEVVEIYWQLGDIHAALGQSERAQSHFEKALGIDAGHEPSLRALIELSDREERWDRSADYRQSLAAVLDPEARYPLLLELGAMIRQKVGDSFRAVDVYEAAQRLRPDSLEVMDALYALYRETRQGQKAVEVLEKMLAEPAIRNSPQLKRAWFALGEICRDELRDYDRAAMAFNAALDADYRFIEAFSALEALLGSQQQWMLLEENYARMIQRLPKGPETNPARMTLWRALGDLYRQVLNHPEGALMAYKVVAAGLPDDGAVQETYAELAGQKPGEEKNAIDAWRRALPHAEDQARIVSAVAALQAKLREYDLAYLAAQASQGLLGQDGEAEREILRKLGPWAQQREQPKHALTDRHWRQRLFHPNARGALADVLAILAQHVGHHFTAEHGQYQLNVRKHRIDVANAQVLQIHQYRAVSRALGMEAVELFSPFLAATLERVANKRSNEPAPEPMVGIEICHTEPVCLKLGGRCFPRDYTEAAQREFQYGLGRALALLRPELVLTQRVAAQKLDALVQAAVSLSVQRFHFTADPRALDEARRLLDKGLPPQAKVALQRAVAAWVPNAQVETLSSFIEAAELTASRAGLFVAGEMEPVRRLVAAEGGTQSRVSAQAKLRDLVVFAVSEDLHALRVAVGTSVEVGARG